MKSFHVFVFVCLLMIYFRAELSQIEVFISLLNAENKEVAFDALLTMTSGICNHREGLVEFSSIFSL